MNAKPFALAGVFVGLFYTGTAVSALAILPAVPYQFDITTAYGFSNPFSSTFLGGGTPSPDTSFFEISNRGPSTFNGTLGSVAVSNASGDYSFSSMVTLAPGQGVSIAVGDEASNVGGFNGSSSIQIYLNGTVSIPGATSAINLSVYDADIHSGVPRTTPYGLVIDSYVLQGGDPYGRDTGDDFEVAQAQGHYQFSSAVPVPAAVWLFGSAMAGLGVLGKRRASPPSK